MVANLKEMSNRNLLNFESMLSNNFPFAIVLLKTKHSDFCCLTYLNCFRIQRTHQHGQINFHDIGNNQRFFRMSDFRVHVNPHT